MDESYGSERVMSNYKSTVKRSTLIVLIIAVGLSLVHSLLADALGIGDNHGFGSSQFASGLVVFGGLVFMLRAKR